MTVARHELEQLRRRLLARAMSGGALTAALGALLLMSRAVAFCGNHLTAGFAGAILGLLAAIHIRRRMERDLLEAGWAVDVVHHALPPLAILAIVSPWAAAFGPAASVVFGARAVLLAQEALALGRVEALLSRRETPSLPRIRRLRLPDAAAIRPTPGVDVVAWNSEGTARCPVCSEELSREAVRCADCWTPHHQDCFRYNAGCGVYACGGTAVKTASSTHGCASERPAPLRRRAVPLERAS
ncbi:MAG: hypothetical protein HY303_17110 [Candidatus Wallbacteria bacterium]|nr:hypothetical protein [Candidatus Wallbacteria bacterium]